jgi:hypothetical protein
MASSIFIQVGALTSSRTFVATDVKIRDTLLKFYEKYNLGPAGDTNQQKLDAVLDWFVNSVRNVAKEAHVDEGRAALETEADTLYPME